MLDGERKEDGTLAATSTTLKFGGVVEGWDCDIPDEDKAVQGCNCDIANKDEAIEDEAVEDASDVERECPVC